MTSDQMLFDIFVTALEGGIGYWSAATEYHWAKQGDHDLRAEEDLEGFYAVILDVEDDDKQYRIDRAVITKGIATIMSPSFETKIAKHIRKDVFGIAFNNPDVDYDAETADCIVQAGLFGELVYG
jgi:hypothetical protein